MARQDPDLADRFGAYGGGILCGVQRRDSFSVLFSAWLFGPNVFVCRFIDQILEHGVARFRMGFFFFFFFGFGESSVQFRQKIRTTVRGFRVGNHVHRQVRSHLELTYIYCRQRVLVHTFFIEPSPKRWTHSAARAKQNAQQTLSAPH